MITLQTGMGPCGMMDRMGLGVVHHVATLIDEANSHSEALSYPRYIDERFIQPGHLGVTSGQGFYSYPESNVRSAGFHLTRNRPTHTTGSTADRPELAAPVGVGLNDHSVSRNGAR